MAEECCPKPDEQEKPAFATCPECGAKGKQAQRMTLGALLKPSARKRMPPGEAFVFCRTPECPVVYFSGEMPPFHTDDLSVRVFQKVKEEPKPVCYCFDYTAQAIVEDVIKNGGKTDIPAQITAQVKAGNCFCEITNPQGSCCLSNVSQAVKEGVALYAQSKKTAR